MTTYFFKNLLLGSDLTEQQMADIPNPRFELHYHVLYKTTQMGAILGMVVVGPLVALARKRPFLKTIVNSGKYGAAIGVVGGPVMTESRLRSAEATPEAVYDRSYRIRHNRTQVRVDRTATLGLAAGLASGFALPGTLGLAGGATVGIVGGTILGAVINMQQVDKPKPPAKSDEPKQEETTPEEPKQDKS